MPVKSVRLVLVGVAVLVASLVGLASPAVAATIHVGPGESIQAAVDAAEPGDTIVVAAGTYHESVVVREDDLTILGADASPIGTILEPPPNPPNNLCQDDDGTFSGFCILGELPGEDEDFEPGGPVVLNTHIDGFLIRGFPASGLFAFHARFSRFSNLVLEDNDEYGLYVNDSQGTRINNVLASGSDEAGLYVGDTANSATGITDSNAFENGTGIFIRDASQGLIDNVTVSDNCIGVVFLNTGLPNGVNRWTLRDSTVSENNAACPETDEAPPLSGIGVALLGTRDVTVINNRVNNNQPSGPTFASGGILVASSANQGGSNPVGNRIESNLAKRNRPADLFYDGSGSNNQFVNNDCNRSIPKGLCT